MPDLATALSSGQLSLMIWTAAALGLIHTILGPDHYVPFVMMAKADEWSRKKTFVITTLCGLGHVVGSIVIAGALIAGGTALANWEATRWASIHEMRGGIAAWLLMGFGAALAVWGVVRAVRGHEHTHVHTHPDGGAHEHPHDHAGEHMHAHEHAQEHAHEHAHEHAQEHAGEAAPATDRVRKLTPWILFTIFVFGPCESLIPLMLASYAAAGLGGTSVVALAFAFTTVVTILVAVAVLLYGISFVRLGSLERWSGAVAGLSLVICGGCIQFLGL